MLAKAIALLCFRGRRRREGVAGEVEDVRSVYRWVQAGHILHEVARSALPMAHNGNGFGFCFSCSLAEAFKIHAAHAGRGSRGQGEVRQAGASRGCSFHICR